MIIVEDGSGIENANSYVDASYVNDYCESMNYTDWDSNDSAEVNGCILRGMKYIETNIFIGVKNQTINNLEWPRSYAYERNGLLFENDSIPLKVKQAVCEATYQERVSPGALQPNIVAGNMKKEEYGSVSFEYFESQKTQRPIFPSITGMLKGLVQSKNTIIRS
ncbi:MAG: DnaT-like ssDNA-binding protein [Candidatus Auribacterota bacterium]|nr:DnaT-like ssDNA-binding protein [Candidatus Auribacterota bacterium]